MSILDSTKSIFIILLALSLSSCGSTTPKLGGSKGNTITGGAAGGNADGENSQLESCDAPLGTLSVVEDRDLPWYRTYNERYPNLGSTVPVIKVMIQQSNCFVVVERGGKAFEAAQAERELLQSGDLREGSNFGKGQLVAADYTMAPSIQFSEKDTSGAGGLLGGIVGGVIGVVGGGLKANEAATTMLLIDNRSTVQISSSVGNAKNFDYGFFGGAFIGALVGVGGYSDSPEGKIITAAFADSYNHMVNALRNYQAQEVKGGLGKGGNLGVGQ